MIFNPGVQLYTLQAALASDFEGTLATLHQIGYREVEVVGLLGRDAKSYRAALDAAGLKAPSVHVLSRTAEEMFLAMATGRLAVDEAWARINASMNLAHIEQIMDEMFAHSEVLGNEYLVLASIDSTLFESRAGIGQVVAAFGKAADLCRKQGLKFGWHPHLTEFKVVEGKQAIDWVLEETDPQVSVELDFFWAAVANVDVRELLANYPGRFHLGHIKDLAKHVVVPKEGFTDLHAISDDAFEDVGCGQLDYRSWIALGREAGMQHFFVERDNAPRPLDNVRRSFGEMRRLLDIAC